MLQASISVSTDHQPAGAHGRLGYVCKALDEDSKSIGVIHKLFRPLTHCCPQVGDL